MRTVTRAELAALAAAARGAPRLRHNLNLHPELADPVQRLLNAFEPGTYVRPHRHAASGKWELFAWLAGRAVVLGFSDDGVVTERVEIDAATPLAEIPAGCWHTLAALEPGTVLLEVKPGPYAPLVPEGFAPWAPVDGTPQAAALEQWFRQARVGARAPR